MGTVGQKITTSEDPSCLVGSAAYTPALACSELAAGRSDNLLAHPECHAEGRIIGVRSRPSCIELLTETRHDTVGKVSSSGFV
jgi:hypothetical protein